MCWRRERTALGLSGGDVECERVNHTPRGSAKQRRCFLPRRGTPGVFKSRACFHSMGDQGKGQERGHRWEIRARCVQIGAQTSKEELAYSEGD